MQARLTQKTPRLAAKFLPACGRAPNREVIINPLFTIVNFGSF